MSDGSAESITDAFTQMRINADVYQLPLNKAPTLTHEAKLTWEGFAIKVIFYQQRFLPGAHLSLVRRNRASRAKLMWVFTVGEIQHPMVFRSHELPMFTAFITECHRRFSAAVRDNRFDKRALLNPCVPTLAPV